MAMLPDAEESNTGELTDLYNYISFIQHATEDLLVLLDI